MARQKAVANRYDGPGGQMDKYERKYFRYLGTLRETGEDIVSALGSRDLGAVKQAIRNISNSIHNHVFLIGLACVVIDREQLYIDAGYKSYLDFVKVLYEETGLSPQSFSAAKIIVERYIDYHAELVRHGFTIDRNTNKLLHLEAALANHADTDDVFEHIAHDKFVDFVAYSRTPDGKRALPQPSKIKVVGNKIYVGKKLAVTLAEELDPKTRACLEKINVQAGEALEAGEVLYATRLYDMGELRRFEKGADRLKKELRGKR